MAINKNDYLDVDGNYDLKKSLVDEVIDGVNNVVESGSNADGSWTKFPDGTVIFDGEITVTRAANRYYEGRWTYPVTLVDTPVVLATRDTGLSGSHTYILNPATRPSTTSCLVRLFSVETLPADAADITIYLSGKGRWK